MTKLIRIAESDDWIVDYDRERGMYRVSYFQDNHFQDEFWFDAYEDNDYYNTSANGFDPACENFQRKKHED